MEAQADVIPQYLTGEDEARLIYLASLAVIGGVLTVIIR